MSNDTKPAILSAAEIEAIRASLAGHIGSLEKRRMIERLLAHIDALTAGDVDAETLGERLFYALHPGCDLVWKHYNGESRAPWIAAAVHLFTIGFAAGRIEGDEDRGRLRLIADKQNAEVARLTAELAAERQKHAEAVAEAKAICAKTCEERDAVLSMHLEAKEKARIEGARVEREACAKSLLALSRDPLTSRQMVLVAGILAAVEHIRARGEGGPS